MSTQNEVGDKIVGYKILCEARQIKEPTLINKSGRHKSMRTTLKDNAEATILRKVKYIK